MKKKKERKKEKEKRRRKRKKEKEIRKKKKKKKKERKKEKEKRKKKLKNNFPFLQNLLNFNSVPRCEHFLTSLQKTIGSTVLGNKSHILKYFETRQTIARPSCAALTNVQPSGINSNSGL